MFTILVLYYWMAAKSLVDIYGRSFVVMVGLFFNSSFILLIISLCEYTVVVQVVHVLGWHIIGVKQCVLVSEY